MDVTERIFSIDGPSKIKVTVVLFSCRILSSMPDRIRLWCSTKPLFQGDSAAVVLTVIPKLSRNLIKLSFTSSAPLSVRNFSAEP